MYFQIPVTFGSTTLFGSSVDVYFGGSSTGMLIHSYILGDDHVALGLGSTGIPLIITTLANRASNYSKGLDANPRLYITSQTAFGTSTAQWGMWQHDTTQFIVATGFGDLYLNPVAGSYVKFGTHSAIGAETVTGYITMKDAGGTTRKLAVVS